MNDGAENQGTRYVSAPLTIEARCAFVFFLVVRPTRRPEARLDKDVREIGREEKVPRDPMRSAVVESVGRELAGWRHRIVL